LRRAPFLVIAAFRYNAHWSDHASAEDISIHYSRASRIIRSAGRQRARGKT